MLVVYDMVGRESFFLSSPPLISLTEAPELWCQGEEEFTTLNYAFGILIIFSWLF